MLFRFVRDNVINKTPPQRRDKSFSRQLAMLVGLPFCILSVGSVCVCSDDEVDTVNRC